MNKRFKFQFERVLDLRVAQLEKAERELAEAQTLIRDLERRLSELSADRAACLPSMTRSGGLDGGDLRAWGAFRSKLNRDEVQFQQLLQQAAVNLQRCKELYTHALREHRLLESLKQRRRQEWQRESDRDEDKQSSDLFLSQWNSGRR